MGRHSKACIRQYRKKQKLEKRKKHSILTRRNEVCNTGFGAVDSSSGWSSTCRISGIETITSSQPSQSSNTVKEDDAELPSHNENHKQDNDTKPKLEFKGNVRRNDVHACKSKRKLPTVPQEVLNDPLYIKYQEYKLHNNRLHQLKHTKI